MSDRARRREQSREDILAAGAHAIAEHGYYGTSMRELARATGKGLATFYNYFPSKEELLYALQSGAFETLLETVEGALAQVDDPIARLHVFISNHVRYVAEHPDIMRVLVHEASALPRERRASVRTLKQRYFDIGRGLVRQIMEGGCGQPGAAGPEAGLDAKELDRATYSIFGMLNWLYGWYEPEVHGTADEVARTIHNIALCGLVTHCPHRPVQDRMERLLEGVNRPSLIRSSENGGRVS